MSFIDYGSEFENISSLESRPSIYFKSQSQLIVLKQRPLEADFVFK